MMGSMAWRDKAAKLGFPLFIVVAIVAGGLMWVAISHRTPPDGTAAVPYQASATTVTSAAPATTGTSTATARSTTPPSAAPVRLAVFGGGTTNGNSPNFADKMLGGTSWVNYVTGQRVNLVEGWAAPGASSQRIAAAARPAPADVVVIGIGVDDQLNSIPFNATTANIDKMVTTVNAPKVVLLSAPPFEPVPMAAGTLNTQLQQLATNRGWTFLDAAAGVRNGTGYNNGTSDDGKTPNATGAAVIGGAVQAAIVPR